MRTVSGPASVESVLGYLADLQSRVIEVLESEDGSRCARDDWNRGDGGRGSTRVLRGGPVFEQAAVSLAAIRGRSLPVAASPRRPELAGYPFHAAALSIVVHPANPYVPTSHAHIRFFSVERGRGDPVWWFGGGFDLTPVYAFEEDVVHWHRTARDACAPFGDDVHPRLKAWCDEYFFIPHRDEPRGVGGLFFDGLDTWGFERSFAFTRAIGEAYLEAYGPIVRMRKATPFGERERSFQLLRRGRYVEFNLVYDRGTLFGLQNGARAESILVSLPPLVAWRNDWVPEPGSPEAELYERFLKPRDWV